MILRVIIQNFLSFYEKTEFNMFPNPKREHFISHVYQELPIPLLKEAAIYGANASGKSNLVKAMAFLKNFVVKEEYVNGMMLEEYRFQLKKENKEPLRLAMEFLGGGEVPTCYIYQVEISAYDVVTERLYRSGLGKEENSLLFERDGYNMMGPEVDNKEAAEALLKKNPLTSVLALNKKFPVLKGEEVHQAYEWFDKTLEVLSIKSKRVGLIRTLYENDDLMKFTSDMLTDLQISNELKINEQDFSDWVTGRRGKKYLGMMDGRKLNDYPEPVSASHGMRDEFIIVQKDGKQRVQELLFQQTGLHGYQCDMDIDSQSDGTVRLLTLIPLLYEVIHSHKVAIVDEIENSMHPNLVFKLMGFFSRSHSNGQLVFTTHLTQLMNQQELMRPDEIWLVEKTNGSSQLKCLNDYRIHNTVNLENGYREGRYGGVPVIGELPEACGSSNFGDEQ